MVIYIHTKNVKKEGKKIMIGSKVIGSVVAVGVVGSIVISPFVSKITENKSMVDMIKNKAIEFNENWNTSEKEKGNLYKNYQNREKDIVTLKEKIEEAKNHIKQANTENRLLQEYITTLIQELEELEAPQQEEEIPQELLQGVQE